MPLLLTVMLLPLAAAPLPGLLQRRAGVEPALPALVAALATLALSLALLPGARSGTIPIATWPWVPALGLRFALRADALAAGFAVAIAAGSVLAIVAVWRDPGGRAAPQVYGRALALTAAALGAALAEDLVLLWLCLELAALAAALLLGGDRNAPQRRRAARLALCVTEAGGLALLAGVLLVADIVGSGELYDVLPAGAALRAHPLYLPAVLLVLAGAAARLVHWPVRAGRVGGYAALVSLALAVFLPIRLGAALGGTRAWALLLTACAAGGLLLAAVRLWRGRAAAAGPPLPSLLDEFARGAALLWRPLLEPPQWLSLVALGAAAGGAVVLGVGGARPGAWPALASAAWPLAAGSSWLLLAVTACRARRRSVSVARALGLAAVAANLLLTAFAPAALAAAQLAGGLLTLGVLCRALEVPWPPRRTLVALGAALAAVATARALVAAPPAAAGALHAAAGGTRAVLAPLVLPLAAAAALLALPRASPGQQRALAGGALLANLALAAWLLMRADRGAPLAFVLGSWPAPGGMPLLLDRFAGELLLIAAMVAVLVFGHALESGADRRGRHFHALGQLLLLGVAGCVLAADLLALFVFFEVLLAAFAGLLAQDGAAGRAAARAHVAATGATGAGLFLIAIGCIYGTLGTVGCAELALRVPQLATGEAPLLRVGAYLLCAVFALRAAALPLGLWLARACEAAPAAAGAFLVVLVQVGIYALLRLDALVFPCFGAGPCGPSGLVLPLGLATLAGGGVGALASTGRRGLGAQLLLVSVGTLLVGAGGFRAAGFAAAAFALAPAALAGVALALASGGAVGAGRGGDGPVRGALGIAALGAALGVPPFAGAVGRIAILGASAPDALVVWSLVLATGLLAMIGTVRVTDAGDANAARPESRHGWAAGSALALIVALSVAAGPAFDFASRVADALLDRRAYVAALLGGDERPAP